MAETFLHGDYYYLFSPIDTNPHFVGRYIGEKADGFKVFENSKGEIREALYGHFYESATSEQVAEFY